METARPGFIFTLNDGAEVFLGPVIADDAWRLRQGLAQMSSHSRYLRFFSGCSEFSESQVRYFTQVDQKQHVAWGVMDVSVSNLPGVGIGRFAIDENDDSKAEWAIAIIDSWQRRGLGTILLAVLYLEAEKRDVKMLTARVLPENRQVLDWFTELGAQISAESDALAIDLPVSPESPQLARTRAGRNLIARMDLLRPLLTKVRADAPD